MFTHGSFTPISALESKGLSGVVVTMRRVLEESREAVVEEDEGGGEAGDGREQDDGGDAGASGRAALPARWMRDGA